MRICMLAEVPGAADSRIFNQASSLKKAGYQVTLIEPGRTGVPALEVVRGLQVLRVFPYRGEDGFAPDPRALGRRYVRQAGRRAARIEADVYHASGRSALRAAAGAAHTRGARLVYDAVTRPPRSVYSRLLEKRGLARACLALATHAEDSLRLRDAAPGVPVRTVRTRFPAVDTPRSVALLRRFGLGPDHDLLFIPVSDRPAVGLRSLLAALGRKRDTVHAVLSGFGGGRARAEAWHRKALEAGLGHRVHLAWFASREEMVVWAAGAHLGCVVENPPREADDPVRIDSALHCLSARLPALLPDLPPFRDLDARHDCFRIVEYGDPSALSRALGSMLKGPEVRRRLAAAARRAADRESWEREASILVEAYRRYAGAPDERRIRPVRPRRLAASTPGDR